VRPERTAGERVIHAGVKVARGVADVAPVASSPDASAWPSRGLFDAPSDDAGRDDSGVVDAPSGASLDEVERCSVFEPVEDPIEARAFVLINGVATVVPMSRAEALAQGLTVLDTEASETTGRVVGAAPDQTASTASLWEAPQRNQPTAWSAVDAVATGGSGFGVGADHPQSVDSSQAADADVTIRAGEGDRLPPIGPGSADDWLRALSAERSVARTDSVRDRLPSSPPVLGALIGAASSIRVDPGSPRTAQSLFLDTARAGGAPPVRRQRGRPSGGRWRHHHVTATQRRELVVCAHGSLAVRHGFCRRGPRRQRVA
jgi:hypothetical protein